MTIANSSLSLRRFWPVLAATLVACASFPQERGSPAAGVEFELTARVAIRYGNEGATGRIVWRHGRTIDEMLITSPVGQGVARITRRDDEVTLVTADQNEYGATDAESLTERVLGWRLPLKGLPDWVQGRAQSGRPAELLRDAQSRLTELKQDDWRIEYQEYEGVRPSKLRISRDDLEIRLVVDQWLAPR